MGGLWGVILTPLIFSVLVAFLLNPIINYLERQGLSKTLSIVIMYIFFLVVLILLCFNLVPTLIRELQELIKALPGYTEIFLNYFEQLESDYKRFDLPEGIRQAIDEGIEEIQKDLILFLERLTQLLISLFSQVLALFLVPIFTFYFLRDSEKFKATLMNILPEDYRETFRETLNDINTTVGTYLRGLVLISGMVGTLVYIGLLILGVEFALFLGLLNALTNFIPYFGPVIGSIPATLIALLQSPALAWKVVLLIILIQQVESQLLAPQILGRKLGFHPLSVILAVLLGGKLFGFIGLVLSVPMLAIIRVIVRHTMPLLSDYISKVRLRKI